MNKPLHNCKQLAKNNPIGNSLVVTDFGTRAISDQNFSKVIALPKTALTNLGNKISKVNVQLVQENGIKYIKLVPISGGKSK